MRTLLPEQKPQAGASARAPVEAAMPSMTERQCQSLDELWTRRDEPEAIRQTDAVLAEALREAPDEPALLWRAARARFWMAEVAEDPKARQAVARQGWDDAERALAKQPDLADAHYWAAATSGTYAEAKGVLAALAEGLEAKFRKHLDWAVERAPDYDYGGPLLTLGRYWAQLPWPKRDRRKALQSLRMALQRHPENLRARLYLAEVLRGEKGAERREALKLVEEILTATPGAYDAPEERLIQRRARALRPEIEREL